MIRFKCQLSYLSILLKRRFIRWVIAGIVEDSADGGPIKLR